MMMLIIHLQIPLNFHLYFVLHFLVLIQYLQTVTLKIGGGFSMRYVGNSIYSHQIRPNNYPSCAVLRKIPSVVCLFCFMNNLMRYEDISAKAEQP